MGFSLCLERGHEGHSREVPQEDRCSSMYINCYALLSCAYMYSRFMLLSLHPGNLIRNIDWCLFRRLKINHDIHKFTLHPGTIANNYSQSLKDPGEMDFDLYKFLYLYKSQ
jgi:hypothetical protein